MSFLNFVLLALFALGMATQTVTAQSGKLLPPTGGEVRALTGPYGSTLGPFSSLKPDCTLIATAAVKVIEAPTHGRLRVYQGRGQPAFATDSGFKQCNGRRVQGTMVSYDLDRGYKGEDTFRIEIVFVNGERRPLSVRMDNRAAKRALRAVN